MWPIYIHKYVCQCVCLIDRRLSKSLLLVLHTHIFCVSTHSVISQVPLSLVELCYPPLFSWASWQPVKAGNSQLCPEVVISFYSAVCAVQQQTPAAVWLWKHHCFRFLTDARGTKWWWWRLKMWSSYHQVIGKMQLVEMSGKYLHRKRLFRCPFARQWRLRVGLWSGGSFSSTTLLRKNKVFS